MLMLTVEAFIMAIRMTLIAFLLTCSLGLFFVFQGRRTNAKLLLYYGLAILCTGISGGVGGFIDFITVLITGNNMDRQLFTYITWTPAPIGFFLAGYVLAELLIPKKKWYYLSITFTLTVLYLLDLYIFHWTPETYDPAIPGETLLNSYHDSVFTRRWWFYMWSIAVVAGIGILFKSIGTKGIIRKKYYYLAVWNILFGVSQILRGTLRQTPVGDIIYTIIYWSSIVFSYLGLRAAPEQRKKKVKKKIKLQDSLFRIIERPEQITEEEVSYYREQKICLMCKGKVAGFNIFLCPKCEALYHKDCARALSDMENACWACNDPIDKTKPTKPFKMVEVKKDIEVKNKDKLIQN